MKHGCYHGLRTRNSKLETRNFLLLSVLLFVWSVGSVVPARAAVTTPFVGYTSDLVGSVLTNAVTIEAWPGTNSITGVTTQLVINIPQTFYPAASNGYFAGALAPGNYRLNISGLTRGITFGISASTNTQNIAQLAGVPVYAFQNFTVAQFSDAGSAAYSNASAFLLASQTNWPVARVTNAGTAAYSNATDFVRHWDTNWPLARITNAGTAAYSNAGHFLLSSDTNWPVARITNAGTMAYSNASAFVPFLQTNRAAVYDIGTLFSTQHVGTIGNLSNGVIWTPSVSGGNFTNVSLRGTSLEVAGVTTLSGTNNFTGSNAIIGTLQIANPGVFSKVDFTNAFGDALVGMSGTTMYLKGNTNIGVVINAGGANALLAYPTDQHLSFPGGFQTTGTNNFFAGADLAFGRYAITTLVNGDNAGVIVGTNVFVQVSGPTAAFTIHGFNGAPNRDGKIILVLNLTTYNLTIAHDSGIEPTAANRIYTMTGADRATTGNGAAMLIYSGSASRWILFSLDP